MVEGQVDDAVRLGRSPAHAVEVLDVAMQYLHPRRSQLLGARLRARQSQNLVPSLNQLGNKRRTDESRCPGHKDTHDDVSFSLHKYAAHLRRRSLDESQPADDLFRKSV